MQYVKFSATGHPMDVTTSKEWPKSVRPTCLKILVGGSGYFEVFCFVKEIGQAQCGNRNRSISWYHSCGNCFGE